MNELHGDDHQDDSERDIKQPPAPIGRTHATVDDATGSNQSHKKETRWPQRIEAVCAVLLVIITGLYTYYAAGQLHKLKRSTEATEKAAKAAEGANVIAHDSLVASQRPWIGMLDPSKENIGIKVIPNPMRPDEPHLERFIDNISYVLKNFGNSPARRVQNTIFVIPTNEMPRRGKPMGCLISDSYSKNAAIESFIILPHESVAKTRSSRSPVTYDMFNGGLKQMWLSACITYQDAIGDSLHHTWLLYQSIPFGETPVLFINSSGVASTRVSGWKMVDSDAD